MDYTIHGLTGIDTYHRAKTEYYIRNIVLENECQSFVSKRVGNVQSVKSVQSGVKSNEIEV